MGRRGFLVEADKFAWALPFGVVALPAVLALFPAAGFAIARLLWSSGPARIFALAFGLGLAEWARGLLFTGFPWNDLGMALGANLTLAQIASVVGLHGLTFLTIAIFAAPATLWRVGEHRLNLVPTGFAMLALALIAAFGAFRLSAPASATLPGVKLRLIQPNVGQDASFSRENKDAILARYFNLSDRATAPDRSGVRDVTHPIWPESAFPFILSREPGTIAAIATFLGGEATLVTGAARLEKKKAGGRATSIRSRSSTGTGFPQRDTTSSTWCRLANTCRSKRYWRKRASPSSSTFPAASSPARAPGRSGFPVCRTRCRSSAMRRSFPLKSAAFSPARAAALAPERHRRRLVRRDARPLSALRASPAARYRTRRALVRDANSGISAVIDGFGREIAFAPLGGDGVVDSELPEALPPTWQSRLGSVGAALIGLAFLAAALAGKRKG